MIDYLLCVSFDKCQNDVDLESGLTISLSLSPFSLSLPIISISPSFAGPLRQQRTGADFLRCWCERERETGSIDVGEEDKAGESTGVLPDPLGV